MSFRILLVGLIFSGLGFAHTSGGQMKSDEQGIRDLFDDWIKATTEGNLELAHRCIADDALFFVPGAGEMDKIAFAQAAAGVSPEDSPSEFDLESEIREMKVFGDYAYIWVESTLVTTPKNGDPATKMAGHSLSVLEKREGRWQIFRDANTLSPAQE
jgi:uncharacterized protein (TIGR02246 family)